MGELYNCHLYRSMPCVVAAYYVLSYNELTLQRVFSTIIHSVMAYDGICILDISRRTWTIRQLADMHVPIMIMLFSPLHASNNNTSNY